MVDDQTIAAAKVAKQEIREVVDVVIAGKQRRIDAQISSEAGVPRLRAAMALVRAMTGEGKKVAILFGPERAGLENDDIIRANAIITVPVNPDFFSLNLAQCVLLLAYEWRRQTVDVPPVVMEMAGADYANASEIQALAAHYEEKLDQAGFFFPDLKAPKMKQSLRNMWSRLGLTRAEVQTFHGMLRQIAYKLRQQGD